jgi:hypothetical protein
MKNRTALDLVRVMGNVVVVPLAIFVAFGGMPLGKEAGTIGRDHEPLLAAAGWAYAIWGLVFAGQLGYAIYQAFPREHARSIHRRIGWLTIANAALGAGSTLAFALHELALAWVMLLAAFTVLVAIELALRNDARRGGDYWLVRLPYAINFGWMTVVLVLGTTRFLVSAGYDGSPLSPLLWSYVLVVLITMIGVAVLLVRGNEPFALAVAWGLVAIAEYRSEIEGVAVCALAGGIAIVVLAALEYVFVRRSPRFRPRTVGVPERPVAARPLARRALELDSARSSAR